MCFLCLQIKIWIFTHLRVVGKKDVLVYPTITVFSQLMASSHHLWATEGWRPPSSQGLPWAAPTSQVFLLISKLIFKLLVNGKKEKKGAESFLLRYDFVVIPKPRTSCPVFC